MTPLLQNHACLRQLLSWNAFKIFALCLKVNAKPYSCEIQNSRNDSSLYDINIRNTHELSHKKRRGTHNRRHQLSTCRCGRLYGTGKFFIIAKLFHHRYSKASCANDVCNGASGYCTHESRGKNSHLCRTAACPARNSVCQINEKSSKPC